MDEFAGLLLGSLLLRPYVFGFFALYLLAAVAEWGGRRALLFTGIAWVLAFLAEASSTRVGLPFGLYHYTGLTRGQELYFADVPFFDSLSFTFLAYASLGPARLVLGRLPGTPATGAAGGWLLAVATGLFMMWLDVVVDPLAVRGDRWFLGRIFYYPEPGAYFGVPVSNFVGWALLGTAIAGAWLALEPRVAGAAPAWARRLPGGAHRGSLLYYLILAFNLSVTAGVAEPALFWAGLAAHLPLAAVVVFCLTSTTRRLHTGRPVSETGA